jgi:hypothetical protein
VAAITDYMAELEAADNEDLRNDSSVMGSRSGWTAWRGPYRSVTANLARASDQLATAAERIDTLFAAASNVATIISPAIDQDEHPGHGRWT